ncbi:alpha/beta fold hydrolase [Mucilaginibacter sp.]|jgi:pimeloyl-ACP methyl ester carboxylesterase|uniref:alpha/beta fold hydrolase n=1 Tax=Mucilaginibacter sp. TaxID=1882438 RepID=UPI0035681AC5
MSTFTHDTVPTQFVDVNGTTYAYRRFGKKAGLPLVFLQHFTGTLDNWDPAVTNAISLEREVIIFDNAGIAASTGEVATTIKGIAATAIAFIDGLGLEQIDLYGYSMGSFVAQEIALARPELIRRLILVGSGPRGGEGLESFSPEALAMFGATYDPADELLLVTLFSPTETSQAAGRKFLDRIRARKADRDVAINDKVVPAQLAAIAEWGTPGDSTYAYLKNINIPVLVVNGKVDVLFPTVNSYLLQQHLNDAKLVLYPDSNHGAQYQFHEDFIKEVSWFLNK